MKTDAKISRGDNGMMTVIENYEDGDCSTEVEGHIHDSQDYIDVMVTVTTKKTTFFKNGHLFVFDEREVK